MRFFEIFESASPVESLWILFFIFFPAIVPFGIYVLIFKKIPIIRPIKDIREARRHLKDIANYTPERKQKPHGEDDYYYDEHEYDGSGAHSGPTIRHPKNRDRAYSGGSERFDDGSR
jgi:hypothetical protein